MTETIQPIVDNIFTDDVVKELKSLEQKTGVRFSKIEEDYKNNFNKLNVNIPSRTPESIAMKRSFALMQVKAETSNLGDNPLVDYEIFVLGASETPKSSRVICYSMMVKKDQSGANVGDPRDLFVPAEGKLGIPTIVTSFDGANQDIKKLMPESWWTANLTVTGTAVPRREVNATSYTNFVPINRPEITEEQVNIWKDKAFPLMTLADIKRKPSRTLPARKEGAKEFTDNLDLRRCVVAIKRVSMNSRTDGSEFCTYTVVDNSLTEAELLNIKDAEGKITKYGGVQIFIPKYQYTALNLAEESLIEVIGTAQIRDEQLSMNAIAVKPIVKKERKTPISQKSAPQTQGIKTQSLADLANKPVTYI